MSAEKDNPNRWSSRKTYLAVMLSHTLGRSTIVVLPNYAVTYGAVGHIMLYTVIYTFIGIPLLYMEYVIGQFTGCDCVEVWRARPCLSHLAYLQIFWKIVNVLVTHIYSAFTLHYLLISFEDPIPYYVCGPWSTPDCNLLSYNYTIHQDCLTTKDHMPYCNQLCTTFPEYQYWRYYILELHKDGYHLAWRVSLASSILCIVLFLSSFKRTVSVNMTLKFYVIFIISASVIFLIGSMLQKGVVVKFDEAMDSDISQFAQSFEFSSSIIDVLCSLSVGSGIAFNLASRNSFRSPCYSNTVIVVVITWAITVISICSNAIMLCPYSFKNNVHPSHVTEYPIFVAYEKIPRMLYIYNSKSFWLILIYYLITISNLCFNTVIISSLMEMIFKRSSYVVKYPGIFTMITIVSLYVLTIPLLGNKSLSFMIDIQRVITFVPILSVTIEYIVFLLCYGFERFSEDIHFMLGFRPSIFIKIAWIFSIFVLIHAFSIKIFVVYTNRNTTWGTVIGWWLLLFITTLTLLATVVKLAIAIYRKNIYKAICLDSSWGPRSEVLKRSRTMFTTHAMTKEYIYRQHHLQAGIQMRQRSCNIRT